MTRRPAGAPPAPPLAPGAPAAAWESDRVDERGRVDGAAPADAVPAAPPPTAATASALGAHPAGSARRTARNVLALISGELVGKVATLVFTVVVARELGATSFGSLSYAFAFGLLLATLVSWGFDAEQVRRASADRDELGAALTTALVLRTLHAVPVLLLGALVGVLTRPSTAAAQTLVLVLLASVLDSYGDAGRSAATALERLGRTVVALVVQRVSACVLAVAVLASGGGLVAVAGAYLLSSVLGQSVLAVLLHRLGVRLSPSAVTLPALGGFWRRTLLLGVDSVLSMALFRLDALLLGALADDGQVAAYAVAYRLMETVLFVTWAVSRSLFPTMVRAGGGAPLLRVTESAISIAGALLVPYGVLVLLDGGDLVRLLFGGEYGGDPVVALAWLAFAPVSFAVGYFGSYLLVVQQRTARLVATTVFAVVVNTALNVVLIPAYGAPGAAAATTASYVAQAVLTVVLIAPGTGVLRPERALLLPALASLALAATLLGLRLPVLVEAPVGGAVYVAAYLLLVRWRDPAQLALLRSLVSRS